MQYLTPQCKAPKLGWLVFTLLVTAATAAAAGTVPCEPSAEVKQALRNLPDDFAERAGELQTLLKRFPTDLFLHRTYQDSIKYQGARELEDLKARYRELAEKHPGDRLYAYLATRTLIGTQTKEAIAQLEKQLEQSPDFPWPHFSLLEIHQAPAFRDPGKARRHLELFMKACPESLEAFRFIRSMEASDFVKQAAERLRAMVNSATEPEAVRAYSTLWVLEFRVRPASEHDALRQQVAEDLKRLRAADPGDSRDYVFAFREGYQLTGDTKNEEWTQNLLKTRFLSKRSAPFQAYDDWIKKNPYPKPDDPPEKRRAHNEALLKASEEWVRQWPDDYFVQQRRFSVARALDDVPAAVVEEAAEGLLKTKDQPGMYHNVPVTLQVAELYASKGVRPERAAELLAQGIQEMEKGKGVRVPVNWDLYTREGAPATYDPETQRLSSQWYAWNMAAGVAIKLKDKDRAREAIVQLDTLLGKLKPSGKGDPKDPREMNNQRNLAFRQVSHWERKGGLAELEGRKMDAFIFYQNAMLARPTPAADAPKPPKDTLGEKTRALWKEFGGTNEGWLAWVNRRDTSTAAAPAAAATGPPGPLDRWTKMDKKLPEFALVDIRGKKWTLADLKGQLTFVTLWATW